MLLFFQVNFNSAGVCMAIAVLVFNNAVVRMTVFEAFVIPSVACQTKDMVERSQPGDTHTVKDFHKRSRRTQRRALPELSALSRVEQGVGARFSAPRNHLGRR